MAPWSTAIVLSQHQPRTGASGGHTAPTTSSPNPVPRAAVIGSHRRVLSTRAMGEKMWERAITRGVVTSHRAKPASVSSPSHLPADQSVRIGQGRLSRNSRCKAASAVLRFQDRELNHISTIMQRNDNCTPIRNRSAGFQRSTTSAAAASEFMARGFRPSQ